MNGCLHACDWMCAQSLCRCVCECVCARQKDEQSISVVLFAADKQWAHDVLTADGITHGWVSISLVCCERARWEWIASLSLIAKTHTCSVWRRQQMEDLKRKWIRCSYRASNRVHFIIKWWAVKWKYNISIDRRRLCHILLFIMCARDVIVIAAIEECIVKWHFFPIHCAHVWLTNGLIDTSQPVSLRNVGFSIVPLNKNITAVSTGEISRKLR